MTYSKKERDICLAKMRNASDAFYSAAVGTGNHAFIEFTGLMNEYIKLCYDASEQGVDFMTANIHAGSHLPFKGYHKAYLNEKLECIYGVTFKIHEDV